MLDAFIIERIRRERDVREDRPALEVETPPPEPEPLLRPAEEQRGVVDIDFSI